MLITKSFFCYQRFLTLIFASALSLIIVSGAATAANHPSNETVPAESAHSGNADFGLSLRHRLEELTQRASDLALSAIGMLGIRYRLGGTDPESGLDCSGLVRYVFKETWNMDLPRTSVEISKTGNPVNRKDLRPGDLVFFNTLRRSFSHVGIYLGDSKFIHAPAPGGEVRIESIDVGYWRARFNGARRIEAGESVQ